MGIFLYVLEHISLIGKDYSRMLRTEVKSTEMPSIYTKMT